MWMRWAVVMCAVGCSAPARRDPVSTGTVTTVEPGRPAAKHPLAFDGDVAVVEVDHWMWCFASKDSVDMCGSTQELCKTFAPQAGSVGCAPARESTCFHTRSVVTGKARGWCFRRAADCRKGMLVWPTDPDEPIAIGCMTLRYAGV